MKLCECGCGGLTLTVKVNTVRYKEKIRHYLKFFETDYIYGHNRTGKTGLLKEKHPRWNGGKKMSEARQWVKKKSNPIVLDKIHKRLHNWYLDNRTRQLLIHSLSYKYDIPIKQVNKEIVEEMLPFYEQYYKAKELLNDKSIDTR